MNNPKTPVSPAVMPVGRRKSERSEDDRSATGMTGRPDPEVVAHAKRRRFTADYKRRTLSELDEAAGSGAIGAILRREGLYSSHLATWRREREAGVFEGLTPSKRGPKSKRDPLAEETEKLRRENARLTERLRKAEIIIDVQKKVAALLGRTLDTPQYSVPPSASKLPARHSLCPAPVSIASNHPCSDHAFDARSRLLPYVQKNAMLCAGCSTANASQIARPPPCAPLCSIKASIHARLAPWIACWPKMVRFARTPRSSHASAVSETGTTGHRSQPVVELGHP